MSEISPEGDTLFVGTREEVLLELVLRPEKTTGSKESKGGGAP